MNCTNSLKIQYVLCQIKKKEKATRLSTAGLWLLSCFNRLLSCCKKLFNRLAKILYFDVFLLKIVVGYFCCFKWVLDRIENKFGWGFAFCLLLESRTNRFCQFCFALRSHLRNPINRFVVFVFSSRCFQEVKQTGFVVFVLLSNRI